MAPLAPARSQEAWLAGVGNLHPAGVGFVAGCFQLTLVPKNRGWKSPSSSALAPGGLLGESPGPLRVTAASC